MLMENLFKNNDILLYQNSCHTSCCVDHHGGGGGSEKIRRGKTSIPADKSLYNITSALPRSF